MAKENKSLNQARHNNEAIKYLDRSPDHLDWVITICFYSSLHYVRSKIFPKILKSDNGGSFKVNSIDEYCRHVKKGKVFVSKHEHLLILVSDQCSEISWEYNQLMDMSTTARYTDYVTDREMSNKAKAFHKKIKTFCDPDEMLERKV
ncbi:hypothetical protein EZJ43_01275 [Pedobacter changchengzhani]|uniref:HEPN domain-containing protein n=1 Tax=Pedobacter changchengzhani TaxID=2529274 RepID=A0A4R5MPN2_9SPHI|nr:hypothetical protein [Pedobacter changchengzhani]TDG37754.1 hypothetical protein EZJ43_01275 [Pedobacter changchengzhani]